MTYTKGPWEIREGRLLIHAGRYIIASVHHDEGYHDTHNANLIAAAPDMYEALEVIMPRLETARDEMSFLRTEARREYSATDDAADDADINAVQMARAALILARGE